MRALRSLLVAALLATTLTGCPFVATVPLGAVARHPLDASVFGDWVWENPQDKKQVVHVVVLPFNDTEYLVEWFDGERAPLRLRVYRVDLEGHAFLNFNALTNSRVPDKYFFARYELSSEQQLAIRFVGEKGTPKALAGDAKGLVDHVTAHRDDPALDDDFLLSLRRARPEEIVEGRLRRP